MAKVIAKQLEGINYAFRFVIITLLIMTILGLGGAVYNIIDHLSGHPLF